MLFRDDVTFHIRGGHFGHTLGIDGQPAKDQLGLAPCDRQFPEGLAFAFASLVVGKLVHDPVPVLDRVDFDFVTSVSDFDGLTHDFGFLVNRVSCEPSEVTQLVGSPTEKFGYPSRRARFGSEV